MQRSRLRDAVAGVLGVAVALGTAELAAGLLQAASPVTAFGAVVIDASPIPATRAAIEFFGTRDKPALIVLIVTLALSFGALLGLLRARWPWAPATGFVLMGLLGAFAVAGDEITSTPRSVVAVALATAAGWQAMRVLLHAAGEAHRSGAGRPGAGSGPSRRAFLGYAAGAAGASAFTALVGRRILGPAVDIEAERAQVALPDPAPTAATATDSAGLQVPGISPLVTPNDEFYRIDTALRVPLVEAEDWRLRVTGMVARPLELSLDELLAMPTVREPVTLACVSNEVGGDLVGNAFWQGVPLAEILAPAGVHDGATQVVGRSVDGFTVGFPTEVALDGRAAMVVVGMNGEPLPALHGFPARLIVPGLYGYVSATKWLEEIELTTLEAFDAYWIPRGWAKVAPIKTQSRIDVPAGGQTLDPGRVAIAGVAWAGHRGVGAVEVRIRPSDAREPAPWLAARLGEELSRDCWRQWVLEWEAEPGRWEITVRATDAAGAVQDETPRPPAPDGATGYHRILVRVRER